MPPSILRIAPVIQLACSESRKVTTLATSVGVPRRPRGCSGPNDASVLSISSMGITFSQSGVSPMERRRSRDLMARQLDGQILREGVQPSHLRGVAGRRDDTGGPMGQNCADVDNRPARAVGDHARDHGLGDEE
jgi:hypothetical protein